MVLQELFARIGFKVDRASMKAATKAVESMQVSLKSMIAPIAKFAAVGGAGIAAVTTAAVRASMQMETFRTEFGVLLQDVQKGADLFEKVHAMAVATPFDDRTLAKSAKTLLAYGVAGEEVMKTLTMLGDVAGADSTKMQYLSLVYGQVMNAGRLKGDDLRQMVNWGVNPLGEIAKKRGISYSEATELMSQRQISAAEVADAFRTMTSEGGRFYGNLEAQSQTLTGKWNKLKGTLFSLAASVGDQLAPSLKQLMDMVSNADFTPVIDLARTIGYYIGEIVNYVSTINLSYLMQEFKDEFGALKRTIGDVISALALVTPMFMAAFGPSIVAATVAKVNVAVNAVASALRRMDVIGRRTGRSVTSAFDKMANSVLGVVGVVGTAIAILHQFREASKEETAQALHKQELDMFMSGEGNVGGASPEGMLEMYYRSMQDARKKYDKARSSGSGVDAARKNLTDTMKYFEKYKQMFYEGTGILWEPSKRKGENSYRSLVDSIDTATTAIEEQTKATKDVKAKLEKISYNRSAFNTGFNFDLKNAIIAQSAS